MCGAVCDGGGGKGHDFVSGKGKTAYGGQKRGLCVDECMRAMHGDDAAAAKRC